MVSSVMNEEELDVRLLTFAEQIRVRADVTVVVEDNKVIVGSASDCAVLFVNSEDNRVWVSFHRECHPMGVATILFVLLDTIPTQDIHFIKCFISDVKGVMSYESEPGFELLHIQYLRDLIRLRGKNTFTA